MTDSTTLLIVLLIIGALLLLFNMGCKKKEGYCDMECKADMNPRRCACCRCAHDPAFPGCAAGGCSGPGPVRRRLGLKEKFGGDTACACEDKDTLTDEAMCLSAGGYQLVPFADSAHARVVGLY